MARVKLNCKCDLCGNMFEHIKFLSSREQADAYEAWAKEGITTCPKCYRETCDTETLRKASERVNLVALSGTDKQIAYAEILRARLICKADKANIDSCMLAINKDDAFMRALRTEAEKANISDDEMLIQTLKSYGLFKLYTCLTETSAEKLLQELA